MTALPLTVRAALWITAALSGRVPIEVARGHVHAEVTDTAGTLPGPGSWPASGEDLVFVALPRPGSLLGMPPADPPARGAALEAGECLLAPTVGGLLVPDVTTFGPVGDQGRLLTWTAFAGAPLPTHLVDAIDPAQAGQQLTGAIAEATRDLLRVGGIPWQARHALVDPQDTRVGALPDGLPPRAARVLVQAARVHSLASEGLAAEQDSPALDAATSMHRALLLRRLMDAADDALAAATNGCVLALAGHRRADRPPARPRDGQPRPNTDW